MLACRLRGALPPCDVAAVAVADGAGQEAALAALARGADRVVLIESANRPDPRAISHWLATLARREQPDLILMGDRAVEEPASQIAPRVAAILGWPCATGVFSMETAGEIMIVQREIDGICEELELALPALIGVRAGLAPLPLLSLYAIVAARGKPVKSFKAASLGAVPSAGYTVLETARAQTARRGRMVADVDELISALREEAHVL